jgi:hypothetical protein
MLFRPILLAALAAAACGDNGAPATCEDLGLRQAVQAEDRYILGKAGAYPADMMMRGQERALYRSQKLRREAAWRTVSKVLAPVALAQEVGSGPGALPLWQSWYAKDDTTRMFQSLFAALPDEAQSGHARFSQETIDEALDWNATELEQLGNWPEQRREDYLAAVDNTEKLAGIGGVGLVSYSPSALRHLLRSYPELLSCLEAGVPGSIVDTPGQLVQQAVREPLTVASCGQRTLGPFYVAEGESLLSTLSGEGADDAQLSIRGEDEADDVACQGAATCTFKGNGAVYVEISAGTEALLGAIQVDYATPDAPWAGCLEGAFATDSVVVKASWRRAQFGETLRVHDTSAQTLRTTLTANPIDGWGQPELEADPGPDSIYTIERPNGNRYRLAGLHIMSKELDHWQWTTLWWSDTPDSDFGEDRPESITSLDGPWSQYKMCTVTMFDEGDADPSGGFGDAAPSLAAALEAVHGGAGAPSWCSNPYIEEGPGNMATNCIGCHQHGGTELLSETIIGDDQGFPAFGRTQLRNNFPHDYSWAPSSGDELTLAFKAVVDFFE